MLLAYLLVAGVVFAVIFYSVFTRSERVQTFVLKTWNGFKGGLLSVFMLENKGSFYILLGAYLVPLFSYQLRGA